MYRSNRPARIIAPLPSEYEASRQAPRAKRLYFAALLGRSSSPTHERDSDEQTGSASDTSSHAQDAQLTHQKHDLEQARPLAGHIDAVCVPIVDAVYRQQGEFIELIARVAREIAAFCANGAIRRAGVWEVCLPLDPNALPETTLYLTLSHEWLRLRFEVQDTSSHQLLLQHVHILNRELIALLQAWGSPYEVDIEIG